MKWTNLNYQSKVLNRLASLAYLHGGLDTMRKSLDHATMRIWDELELFYSGRDIPTIKAGHNMRGTI